MEASPASASVSASSMTLASASLLTALEVVMTESGLWSSGRIGSRSKVGRSGSDWSPVTSGLALDLARLEYFLFGEDTG